jgi:hypothetical protein
MKHTRLKLEAAIAAQLAEFTGEDTLDVRDISDTLHTLALEKGPNAMAGLVEEVLREELQTLEWPPMLGATLIRAVLNEVVAPPASFLDAACIYLAFFHELDAEVAQCRATFTRDGPGDVKKAAALLRRAVDSLRAEPMA